MSLTSRVCFMPKHDHDPGDGSDDGASGVGSDCDIPIPDVLEELFDPQPDAPIPDVPPPLKFDSGSDAEEDLSAEDSSEMGSDESEAFANMSNSTPPPTPCAYDRDMFRREPASFLIEQDACAAHGRVHERLLSGGLGRCLGSAKMVGPRA